jgi:hypothetical protein
MIIGIVIYSGIIDLPVSKQLLSPYPSLLSASFRFRTSNYYNKLPAAYPSILNFLLRGGVSQIIEFFKYSGIIGLPVSKQLLSPYPSLLLASFGFRTSNYDNKLPAAHPYILNSLLRDGG